MSPACPSCQASVSPKLRFCPTCGQALTRETPSQTEVQGPAYAEVAAGKPEIGDSQSGCSGVVTETASSRVTTGTDVPTALPPSQPSQAFPRNGDEGPAFGEATAGKRDITDSKRNSSHASVAARAADIASVRAEDVAWPVAAPVPGVGDAWGEPGAAPGGSASPAITGGRSDDLPIELALHFPHVLVAGHPSTLRLRVTNQLATPLENVEITLDSRGLAGAAQARLRRLAPGQFTTLMVELEPARAGHFIMQAGAVMESSAQRCAFRGSRSLRINQPPDGNIVISIGDIQSNTGGGANAGLGADYGNVQISNLLGGAQIRTLNDLLDLELPENFAAIALELDYELSARAIEHETVVRRRPLQIPSPFLGFVQPGTRCVLKPAAGGSEIRLVARPQFRLGRSRADADYVAWFWPRSDRNDERTMRISKVQVELRAKGLDLVAWDSGSANGTLFDGQPLGKTEAEAVRLTRQAELLLGHEYKLEAEHLAARTAQALRIANGMRWHGPAADAEPRPTGCVQFTPRDTQPSPCVAIWLFSEASFGTSRSNPLVFTEAVLGEIQGRFHFHRGCFWIENAVGNGAVSVNGTQLNLGDIVPLVSGVQLRIGGGLFRVDVQQCHPMPSRNA